MVTATNKSRAAGLRPRRARQVHPRQIALAGHGGGDTFAEEQARWERSDPEYARLCERVRRAKDSGEEASRRADEAKAEWDARVATQRQANDDARRAHYVHTTFAIESDDSPAPGIIPAPVRVHDEPGATTLPRGVRRAARLRFCGPATRNPATRERSRSGVE
jgi:hypothetical protein